MPASHINLLQCLGVHRSFLDFAVFSRLLKQAKVICFTLLSSGIRILCPSRSILRFSIFILIDFTRSSFFFFPTVFVFSFHFFVALDSWNSTHIDSICPLQYVSCIFLILSLCLLGNWTWCFLLPSPSLVLASFSLILCVGCVLCYIRIHLATRQRIWLLPHYSRRVLCFPPSVRLSSFWRGPLLFWSCFSRRPCSPCYSEAYSSANYFFGKQEEAHYYVVGKQGVLKL